MTIRIRIIRTPAAVPDVPVQAVSIVVPCYNEGLLVPHLKNTLDEVGERLGVRYDLEFLIVDDGSTDDTWAKLTATFAGRANKYRPRSS